MTLSGVRMATPKGSPAVRLVSKIPIKRSMKSASGLAPRSALMANCSRIFRARDDSSASVSLLTHQSRLADLYEVAGGRGTLNRSGTNPQGVSPGRKVLRLGG